MTDDELPDCEGDHHPADERPARYTIRDRESGKEYHLCGSCLTRVKGKKSGR